MILPCIVTNDLWLSLVRKYYDIVFNVDISIHPIVMPLVDEVRVAPNFLGSPELITSETNEMYTLIFDRHTWIKSVTKNEANNSL